MRAPAAARALLALALALCCALVAAHARRPHLLHHPHHAHRPWWPQNGLCAQQSVTVTAAPVSCASVHSADRLVPHPADCRLFYYCEQPYLPPVCRQCPANLHFNPVSHVCDWPALAGCSLTSTTNGADYTTTTVSTTTSAVDTTTNADDITIEDASTTTSDDSSTTTT